MLKYVLIALFVFPLVACGQEGGESDSLNTLTVITADNGKHSFKVETAVTEQAQARGLMYRTEMANDAGMLFYFPTEAERGFWMKNTLIPLDIIFIKSDGTIHRIHEDAIPHDLTSVRSNGAVRAVLEINGGLSQKLGIRAGNKVTHPFFNGNSTQ